jgi:hypothetical protein
LQIAGGVVPAGHHHIGRVHKLFLQQRDEAGLLLDQPVNPRDLAVEVVSDGALFIHWGKR